MTIQTAVARIAATVGLGDQDFTNTDLAGAIPKAALFFATPATADNTATDHAALAIGAATATDERWAMFSVSQHGVANTNANSQGMTDQCLAIPDGAGAVEGEADFVAFISNGVRINWGNAPGAAYLVTPVLFAGGDDLQAYAGVFSPGTSVDGTVNVTDPGWEPDVIFFAGIGAPFDDSGQALHMLSFGWYVNDGANTQRSIAQAEADGSAAGAPTARISTGYGASQISSATGGVIYGVEIAATASGFDSVLRTASAGTDQVAYLALKFGDHEGGLGVWAGGFTTPTSTGTQATTTGFEPQLVLLGLMQLTNVDTGASGTANAGAFGVGAFTGTADAYANSISLEEASATTDTQSITRTVMDVPDDDGTAGITASVNALDPTSFTLDFTAVKGTNRNWIGVAIERDTRGRPKPGRVVRGALPVHQLGI